MGNNLTKDILTEKIAEEYDLTKVKSRDIVDYIFDDITKTISNGGEASIYGFGKFSVKHRPERKGFNPSTKELMTIEESNVPSFEAFKNLRDIVKDS